VTFALTVDAPLSGVQSLVFLCPEFFLHENRRPQDVQVLGSGFPSATRDLDHPSTVRLLLAQGAVIPKGYYRIKFKVMIPSVLPPQNLWYLVLCRDTSCETALDPQVIIAFTFSGFLFGEKSTLNLGETTSGVQRVASPAVKQLWAVLAWILVLVLHAAEPRSS